MGRKEVHDVVNRSHFALSWSKLTPSDARFGGHRLKKPSPTWWPRPSFLAGAAICVPSL
jgi:hypothetical protein